VPTSTPAPTTAPLATPVNVPTTPIHEPPSQITNTLCTSSLLQETHYEDSTATTHGWNPYPYNTRFKKRFHANLAPTVSPEDQPLTLDFSTISTLLATHDHLPSTTDNLLDSIPHLALGAQPNPDILHFGTMQHAPDRSDFELDMVREINDFFENGCIQITPRSNILSGEKSIQAIWSYRRKRAPDWTVTKHCSRLCPHVGQQIEGLNYWDTYAPVDSWRTIRLALILSLLSNLKTCQLDYVGAFPQADADCEIYMNIPPGFTVVNNHLVFTRDSTKYNSKHHVLKILKNIYGLRQVGNVWFEKLHDALLQCGFSQSVNDPCLFYRKNCIFIVYVDDCLLFSPSDTVLDEHIISLQPEFKLTHEGDVGAYLGIDIKRHRDGSLELTQPGLVQKIITAVGLEEKSATHDTTSYLSPSQRYIWP
jgi:hypothetical protein